MRYVKPRYLKPTLAVTVLILAGCGSNAATGSSAAQLSTAATAAAGVANTPTATSGAAAASIVPAVDVVDVSTGQSVALRASIAVDKPTLIWMWAPG